MCRALKYPGVAFLDRDGTVNVKAPGRRYIEAPDELCLLPGVAGAIRRLNDASLRVAIITNQRGIALGRITHKGLDEIHERLGELLSREANAHIDRVFYCPHQIGTCNCRKPDTGLFLQAQEHWPDIDLRLSAMVGDSENDVIAGTKMGMTSILLGRDAPDLGAAVDLLLSDA